MVGCSDDEVRIDPQIKLLFETLTCHPEYRLGRKNEIIGEWQLVSYQRHEIEEEPNDFSCDHIVYLFSSDQKVIISSNIDYEWTGVYDYVYHVSNNCPLCLPNANFKLGDSRWYCEITESTMRLVDSENGVTKYLIRKR
ncbi:hypothetical protein LJC57_05130 [Parabacteroides sp. OttesenSCG-928-G07]|nr:hypothetical protein [Parabacteroides sp. OttesenSCG-928-G21]MDL2277959.1 hypothetical protein [Parabacteroides sp. OttesenSCG-928-G07]